MVVGSTLIEDREHDEHNIFMFAGGPRFLFQHLTSDFQAESQTFERLNKSIDFVLVSDESASRPNLKSKFGDEFNDTEIRDTFEFNLQTQGLELEKETVNGLTYVKIHTPRPILRKYCEILKLKMPMKQVNARVISNYSVLCGRCTLYRELNRKEISRYIPHARIVTIS